MFQLSPARKNDTTSQQRNWLSVSKLKPEDMVGLRRKQSRARMMAVMARSMKCSGKPQSQTGDLESR